VKIAKKDKKSLLYKGIFLLLGGIALLFYLVNFIGVSEDFLPNFGKLASLVMIIFGIANIYNYDRYSQDYEAYFSIKDNVLKFEEKRYDIKGAFLSIRSLKKEDFYRVTLWIEKKEEKATTAFEDVVFNTDEMKQFLEMIKPYRKSQECLLDNEKRVKLFDDGFIFENREILYDEIEKFETKLIKYNESNLYLDINIVLKNGDILDKRLNGGIKEYAKVIYARMKYEGADFFIKNCPKNDMDIYDWGITIVDVTVILMAYFGYELFEFLAIVMFFVTMLYLSARLDFSETAELCKEIQRLQKEDVYNSVYQEVKELYNQKI